MKGSFLGPEYTEKQIEEELSAIDAKYYKLSEIEIIDQIVLELTKGKAIGLMQGRMEFGPRALGGRSIIADPRSSTMQQKLNLKIKYRESFRPFAPSVLEEDVSEWFECNQSSPYMMLVANVNKKNVLKRQMKKIIYSE